jgi:hypothetical protein
MAYEDNYTVYGPYKVHDGRQIVVLIDKKSGKRRTVSYPKWIMEKHLGKELDRDQGTVDHWDSNIDNNSLDNLRVIDRKEHSRQDTRRVKNQKFNCAWCKKEFERSPRLIRDKSKKKSGGPFCSRKCSGTYNRMLQLKLVDRLPPQPYVESEYYKLKYVNASDQEIDISYYPNSHEPNLNKIAALLLLEQFLNLL